jgi:hypothetical protein
MMAFKRTVEDFVCGHCGQQVKGTGYTNHCPTCLWSKHVDVSPGDRAEPCGGMMEPIALEGTTPSYRIVHKCAKCAVIRRVGAADEDSPEALVAVSSKLAARS